MGTWPAKTDPSSPGLNARFEQKPSDELISSVSPSFDLNIAVSVNFEGELGRYVPYQVRSVKVAKCKLLTTTIGVICCVSYTRTASCVATA